MAFLNYEYKMKISYSESVGKCYFTIKSIPADDFRQMSISYNIGLSPMTGYSESRDSFGNIQIIGSEIEPHSVFDFTIKGLVETREQSVADVVNLSKIGMYKYPHGKCIPGDALIKYAKEMQGEINECLSDLEKCHKIMEKIHNVMTYEPGSTEIETTAEEAFLSRRGVCQDFSHIYICLLRLFGIPARYVCGLIVGEGKSHAWVEAACDGKFVALDPTHNKEINDEYIKLGVGRDAADCAINRGVMWGGGLQTQEIMVTVEKYY